jgi:hypothetical protein
VTHKFSKYLVLAIGALGLTALPALADSPCTSGSLATYVDSTYGGTASPTFACSVTSGGVTLDFSQFNYTPGGSTQLTASEIGVAPITVPDGPGLSFNPAAAITSGTEDVDVGFTVTAEGGASISDIYIALSNVLTTGTGTVTYDENFCGGPELKCSLYVEAPATNDTNVVQLSTTDIGGPVSSLTITKDVLLSAGSSGSASTTGFLNEYSTTATPEPRAISLLLGLGLLAGFVIFKRRQATQS